MKRRSGTSYPPSPEPLVYFVDRDLGAELVPGALRANRMQVEISVDHFRDPETPDVVWIPEIARRGWVILTQDRGIRRHPHERAQIMAAAARYCCVSGGSRRGTETARMILENIPSIEKIVRGSHPPIIASVTMGGVNVFDAESGAWKPTRAPRRTPQ